MTSRMTRPSRQDLAAARRLCSVCSAKLSAYNDNDTCWAHTVELPWKGPGTKPR